MAGIPQVVEVKARVALEELEELQSGEPGTLVRDEGEAGITKAEGQLASELEGQGAQPGGAVFQEVLGGKGEAHSTGGSLVAREHEVLELPTVVVELVATRFARILGEFDEPLGSRRMQARHGPAA